MSKKKIKDRIVVLHRYVLVSEISAEKTIGDTGFRIPDVTIDDRFKRGLVERCAPNLLVEEGDIVRFSINRDNTTSIDGKTYIVLNEGDIAFIEK